MVVPHALAPTEALNVDSTPLAHTAIPRALRPPTQLPKDGILVGYSLEHERRTAPIGFRYAPLPSVGLDSNEYLEPILHTGGGHLMTIAPTGAGKGVSCIIPTLLRFPGPTIVVDPKGENYAVTAARRGELGQQIILLDPMGITGATRPSSLNPLDLVDPSQPIAIDDAASLSSLLGGGLEKQDPRNLFWYQRGEQLVTGLIQHIAVSRTGDRRNLSELRRLLNLPADKFIEMVSSEMQSSPDTNVQSVAGMLTNPAVEMVGSFMGMAQNNLEFLRGQLVHGATAESSFSLDAVTRGDPLSIYLVIPPDKLESHRNLLRVWIGVLMAALMRRRAPVPHPTLFVLDEAAQLGTLDQLRQAITLMRGYGLQTWSFWQDLSQLQNLYPSDWATMYNNCRVHQSFGFTNLQAAREAAEIAGFHDPLEVLKLDADEMILAIAGDEAVIAQKPNYLTDVAFHGLYADNPFYRRSSDKIPTPRRPQRRYSRPKPPTAAPPAAAAPPATQQPEASAQDAARRPSAFSAASSIVRRGAALPKQLKGVGLEGFPDVEVVPPADMASLLRAVARAIPDGDWSPYNASARFVMLSFYPTFGLYEITAAGRQPAREYVIRRGDEAHRMDWTNRVFYELNERALRLTEDSVLEYVKVFFRFVRGRHGHFHVVERIADLPIDEPLPPAAREALEPHLKPLTLRATQEDGTRVLDARFFFKESVFSATVYVDPSGIVRLDDEAVVVEAIVAGEAGMAARPDPTEDDADEAEEPDFVVGSER